MNTDTSMLMERLAAHRIAGTIPADEIRWLVDHGQLCRLEPGEALSARAAGPVKALYILLSGQVGFQMDRANGREKVMEWRAGDVLGVLPYSRVGAPPGDAIAEVPCEVFAVPRQELPSLIHDCPCFTAALVHVMLDRSKAFTSSDLQADKMASLGKLSAGLAHELNNPAAAIARSAQSLHDAMTESECASRELGSLGLNREQLAAIDDVVSKAIELAVPVVRSPIEQADREAAFEDWLLEHGAEPQAAGSLAETAITLEMLEGLASSLQVPHLNAVMRWLGAAFLTRQLADEIELAAIRISTLVDAVKGFTHMDLNATPSPVDVGDGLAETLAIHTAKARAKAVSVRVEIEPDLQKALGIAGELNQIWANLIDNALDAVGQSGNVAITAKTEGQEVVVRVTDDGPGIPADIKGRIFDPFFTTKKIGQGTGLGLDIVKRIVQKHRGTMGVESEPGRTEFRVALPLA